ncbi:MAG: hypothetical protein EHM42_06780 [Planctomycetaceae bacterium]|nr:MAG: hypothetical protein EHM42_06780 [Planctomycetaceae bacterium]
MGKLFEATCTLDSLHRAWSQLRHQARRSTWPRIVGEVEQIDAAPLVVLRELRQRLVGGDFRFGLKWGYAKRKSGGSRRGITVHPLRDRIVQRAILNILQTSDEGLRGTLGEIPAVLGCATSFAGNPGRGVPEAVALVTARIAAGDRWVALSDVKDFFPRIPRSQVCDYLRSQIDDAAFADLFEAATATELANPEELAGWLDLFPQSETGVAQGSLLSVLAGNLALRKFDARLNAAPLTTARYLDDFAILGPDEAAVSAGFTAARDELDRLGMTCYLPGDGSQKAWLVPVEKGFDFLGCRIHPDGVAPSRRAKRQLLDAIDGVIAEGRRQILAFATSGGRRRAEAGYAQVLAQVDRKIRGWGDAYRFVSNRASLAQLDRNIDERLARFRRWHSKQTRAAGPAVRRRIDGVSLLGDTPPGNET